MARQTRTHGETLKKPRERRVLVALSRFGARLRRDPGTRQWVLDMPMAEGCNLQSCGVTAQLLSRLSGLVGDRIRVRLTASDGTEQHEFEIDPSTELLRIAEHSTGSIDVAAATGSAPDDGPLIRAYLASCYRSSSRQQTDRMDDWRRLS